MKNLWLMRWFEQIRVSIYIERVMVHSSFIDESEIFRIPAATVLIRFSSMTCECLKIEVTIDLYLERSVNTLEKSKGCFEFFLNKF